MVFPWWVQSSHVPAPSQGRWSTGMPRSTGQHPEPTKVQGDDWWSGERWKRLGRGVFHRKTIGKPQENGGFSWDFMGFTFWSTHITMENHHFQWVNPLF